MRIPLCVLFFAALPVVAQAPASLPRDIDPVTLSRLPPVTAADLDEEGRRLLAARTFTPAPGPNHVSIYSPRELDLGIPSGEKSPVGPRGFQTARVLIIAREIDQQYEWSAHEPAGRRQGLSNRSLT